MNDISGTDVQELLPLQKEAVDFIERNFKRGVNSLCATGVGSGKTRIACEVIRKHLAEQKGYALVCCPTSTLIHSAWEKTLESLSMKGRILADKEFPMNIRRSEGCFNPIQGMTYLITYKMLVSNTGRYVNATFFKNKPPSLIVFDEMHCLSNNTVAEKLSRTHIAGIHAQRKLGLTATPMVNETEELACAAGILNGSNTSIDTGFLFFRDSKYTSTECRQLIVRLPLSADEYDTMNRINEKISNEFARISVSQSLLVTGKGKHDCHTYICKDGKTKARALQAILRKIPAMDKIIVFDRQKEILNHLYSQPWILKYNPVIYHGGLPKKKQKQHYDDFIKNPCKRLFLATEQIAGEGLDLQVANHVIILSYGWTPKDIIQMTGRVKRLGQEKDVFIYILETRPSSKSTRLIEESQLDTILDKHEKMTGFISKRQRPHERPENVAKDSLKELGFELATESVPGLFLDNGKIEEDIASFMDSIQLEYIRKETIKKTENIINSPLPIGVFALPEEKQETIRLLKDTRLRKHWENIEQLCMLLIDYDELERQRTVGEKYIELEKTINAEMGIRQDTNKLVLYLGHTEKSDVVKLMHKYLTFLSKETT